MSYLTYCYLLFLPKVYIAYIDKLSPHVTPFLGCRALFETPRDSLYFQKMEGKENEREEYVEVLFEHKGSRKILFLRPSKVCKCVQEELRCISLTNAIVTLSVLPKSTDRYFLQRSCEEWKAYVDVESTDQVIERDKLSVVHNPAFESNEALRLVTCT